MSKVSIIVPIYNSEKCLAKCLDSILAQTLTDIEVLCLDDECKDNSRRIVDEYAKKDSRVVPVHLSGKGSYGRAVNLGFEMAKSDYIGIVESDDWCHEEMFETLYNMAIEKDADIAMCSWYKVEDLNALEYQKINLDHNIQKDKDGIFNIKTSPSIIDKQAYPWKNLYKKEFILKNEIKFREDFGGSYQDNIFNAWILSCAKRICVTSTPLYYYNLTNENSSTNNSNLALLYPERKLQAREIYIKKGVFNNCDAVEHFWKGAYTGLKFFGNAAGKKNQRQYYYLMKDCLKNALKDGAILKFFDSESNEDFYAILKHSYFSYRFRPIQKKYLKSLFNMSNIRNHKVIRVLGIKFSYKLDEFTQLYRQTKILRGFQADVLKRLRSEIKKRPLKVGFLIPDNTKWNVHSLYKELEKSKFFEPSVIITQLRYVHDDSKVRRTSIQDNIAFFKNKEYKYVVRYDIDNKKYLSLEDYDIVFYASPWMVEFGDIQKFEEVSKYALCCYLPYAISEAPVAMIHNKKFFETIFKQYLVDKKVLNDYKSIIKKNRKSLVVTGHTKLDTYLGKIPTNDKHYVIYAPHFTMGKRFFSVGTFDWSGHYILDYAKKHPEFNWVFKPHPLIKHEFERTKFMTRDEIDAYYNEWAKIGQVYEAGGYFDLFKQSDLMITDSASFLLEYYPTQKPIIRLMSKNYTYNNALTEMIADRYYKTYNIDELKQNLKLILEDKKDPLMDYRLKYLNLFQPIRKSAAENIFNDLLKELKIKQ